MNSVVDFSMYMHPYNYHLDHTIGHFNFCNLLLCLFSQFIQQLSRGNDYSDLCRGRLGWPVLEFHINELHCILVCLTCWVGVMFSKFIPVHLCYVCACVCTHMCIHAPFHCHVFLHWLYLGSEAEKNLWCWVRGKRRIKMTPGLLAWTPRSCYPQR